VDPLGEGSLPTSPDLGSASGRHGLSRGLSGDLIPGSGAVATLSYTPRMSLSECSFGTVCARPYFDPRYHPMRIYRTSPMRPPNGTSCDRCDVTRIDILAFLGTSYRMNVPRTRGLAPTGH
jgi:hypothetical protein